MVLIFMIKTLVSLLPLKILLLKQSLLLRNIKRNTPTNKRKLKHLTLRIKNNDRKKRNSIFITIPDKLKGLRDKLEVEAKAKDLSLSKLILVILRDYINKKE
jgi:hypothetical protein